MLFDYETSNLIREARRSSLLTQAEAGDILGMSEVTFRSREVNPSSFSIEELHKLYEKCNETGKRLINEYVSAAFKG